MIYQSKQLKRIAPDTNIKQNKFKISKTSAKIFKKEYGYKVDKSKIKTQSSSVANIPMAVEELGNQYKDISHWDRILAIGNKDTISKQAKLGNSMEIDNTNTDITTKAPSYTKSIMEELNNKEDITGKINNTILICDNENTDMRDVMPPLLYQADLGINLGSNLVGASEGTTQGITSVNNREIPTRQEIMEPSTFGKTSKDHSFTSEACFEHTLIFILKSGFLADTEHKNYQIAILYSNIFTK